MDNWERLVAWETDCPEKPSEHPPECICGGTCKVAVLPLLRHYCKPIAGAEGFHWSREGFPTHDATDGCPGWQAVPRSEEALQLAFVDLGIAFSVSYFPFAEKGFIAAFQTTPPVFSAAANPLDALEAAAVKMMEDYDWLEAQDSE